MRHGLPVPKRPNFEQSESIKMTRLPMFTVDCCVFLSPQVIDRLGPNNEEVRHLLYQAAKSPGEFHVFLLVYQSLS